MAAVQMIRVGADRATCVLSDTHEHRLHASARPMSGFVERAGSILTGRPDRGADSCVILSPRCGISRRKRKISCNAGKPIDRVTRLHITSRVDAAAST
jgi:hypothetical protein